MKIMYRLAQNIRSLLLLSLLGANLSEKIKMCFFVILLIGKNKYLHLASREYCVRLKIENISFPFYFAERDDLFVLLEIFIQKEYLFPQIINPRIIFDLGSNIGTSIIYFKIKYPESIIYGFEPNPETFKRLEKNTKAFSNVFLFSCALSDRNGFLDLYANPKELLSASLNPSVDHSVRINVSTKTLDTFIEEHDIQQIDLMKMDIEGAESAVMRTFKRYPIVNGYIGELHKDLIDETPEVFFGRFLGYKIQSKNVSDKHVIFRAIKK